jgi:hypothetical protein
MNGMTAFPELLQPNGVEPFVIDGRRVEVPQCMTEFDLWMGTPISETFGGKPLLNVGGKPMFAELAIMHRFIDSGWQARWVETYARGNQLPMFLSAWKDDKYKNQVADPIADEVVMQRMAEIAALNGNSYFGCWDVVGWRDGKILFAESKWFKKDHVRETQSEWLDAGLRAGLTMENFLVVQWKSKNAANYKDGKK